MGNLTGDSKVLLGRFYLSAAGGLHQYVPGLNVSIDAYQTKSFMYQVNMSGSTSGVRFQVNAPTGSVIRGGMYAKSLDENAWKNGVIPVTPNTEMHTVSNVGDLSHFFQFSVINGNNAGTVQLGVRRINTAQTYVVESGSFMWALDSVGVVIT